MAKVVKKPVLPIYAVGVTWLIYALIFPLRSLGSYITCALVSALAFAVTGALCPERTYEVPDKEAAGTQQDQEPKPTGNKEVDELLRERQRAISEMRRLNDAIEDEMISRQIDHLEQTTGKIIDHVAANPQKLPQIRRFMNYYLPTTLKILNAYDRMDATGVSGENINATKEKVGTMMENLVRAYDKQMDALFGAEALDISTDITVLENLLAREGFGPMNINNTAAPKEEKEDREAGRDLRL